MTFPEMITKNRSYRRFNETVAIPFKKLREWIDLARLTPSAANLQPVRYIAVTDRDWNGRIFPLLRWAAYLPDWDGPVPGEHPSAYIIMLSPREKGPYTTMDAGIALQTILIAAVGDGFGGCAIASCDKPKLAKLLKIPAPLEVTLVIALGKPVEQVVIDPVQDNNIRYWRDDQQVHHVPKRSLEEIIIASYTDNV